MDDQAILQYAAAHWREMRVVGRGTHTSGILETPEGPVFVKRQALEDNALSPVWARMKRLFGWSFSGQRRCLEQTVRAMATPYIPAARDIGSVEEEKLCVFQVMPGDPWEPDRFPDSAAIARQLGLFTGSRHIRVYDHCGLVGGKEITDFPARLRKYVADLHAQGRKLPPEVRRCLVDGLRSREYVPIMTDFSANQFLFDGDKVTACVDLDACVLGPRSWELALIEDTVPDMAAFRQGYEEYLPYPDNPDEIALFRFLMAE